MGILALCSSPEQQFGRLEFSVGSIVGRARLIPLVEIAILAAEEAMYERAAVYLAGADALSPGPGELHDLYTVAGMVALSGGKLTNAKRYLAKSINICNEDGFALLACRARAANLRLARQLLKREETTAVIEFLRKCQGVWTHATKTFSAWIEAIQRGQEPNFNAPGVLGMLEEPALKMQLLVTLSEFLPDTVMQKSDYGPHFRLDEILAQMKRETKDAVKGKLGASEN